MGKLYTIKEYIVMDMLPHLHGERDRTFVVNGVYYTVRTSSLRYETFRQSIICLECKLIGNVLKLECDEGKESHFRVSGRTIRAHFNLYARDTSGRDRLMTKDHIIPVSKGGPTELWNLQTMCHQCNEKKGNGDPQQKRKKVRICSVAGCSTMTKSHKTKHCQAHRRQTSKAVQTSADDA